MNKAERLQLIQKIWDKRNLGSALRGLLPVSRPEIREAVKETLAPIASEMNDSIEEESNGFRSQIKSEKFASRESEMTDADREELREDVRAYRASREPIEGFSLRVPMEFA